MLEVQLDPTQGPEYSELIRGQGNLTVRAGHLRSLRQAVERAVKAADFGC